MWFDWVLVVVPPVLCIFFILIYLGVAEVSLLHTICLKKKVNHIIIFYKILRVWFLFLVDFKLFTLFGGLQKFGGF
jgi:hypothetical protein